MARPGTRALENDNFLQEFKKYVYLASQFIVGKRSFNLIARMVELVYTYVSEAYASQLASSSLASGTKSSWILDQELFYFGPASF